MLSSTFSPLSPSSQNHNTLLIESSPPSLSSLHHPSRIPLHHPPLIHPLSLSIRTLFILHSTHPFLAVIYLRLNTPLHLNFPPSIHSLFTPHLSHHIPCHDKSIHKGQILRFTFTDSHFYAFTSLQNEANETPKPPPHATL